MSSDTDTLSNSFLLRNEHHKHENSIVLDESYYPNPITHDQDNNQSEDQGADQGEDQGADQGEDQGADQDEDQVLDQELEDEITPSAVTKKLKMPETREAPLLVEEFINNYTNKQQVVDKLKCGTLSETPLLIKNRIKVGTHDGRFHADEVMGVSILKMLYNYLDCQIQCFRSRNPYILKDCDIILDVGQVFNPSHRLFDHHHKSCTETFDDDSNILLSSAGMIWREFGKIFIELYLHHHKLMEQLTDHETVIEEAYKTIYHKVIKEIDAHDNGINMLLPEIDKPEIYRFHKNLNLGNTVAKLNYQPLTEKENKHEDYITLQNGQFITAVEVTEVTLRIHIQSIVNDIILYDLQMPKLTTLYNQRALPYLLDIPKNVSSDPKLLNKVDKNKELLYTVYYRESDGRYGFSTVQEKQFVNRKNLLSMETLKTLLSKEEFEELVFVHKNLFCGATNNHDLAIKICTLSAQAAVPSNKFELLKANHKSILTATVFGLSACMVFVGFKYVFSLNMRN